MLSRDRFTKSIVVSVWERIANAFNDQFLFLISVQLRLEHKVSSVAISLPTYIPILLLLLN